MSSMARMFRYCFAVSTFLLVLCGGMAQNKSPIVRPTPAEIAGQFQLTAQNVAPWHLKARIQLYRDGKPDGEGWVEKFYAGAKQQKTIYTFANFHQVRTVTGDGIFIDGDEGEPPPGVAEWLRALERPANKGALNADTKVGNTKLKVDGVQMHCLSATWDTGAKMRAEDSHLSEDFGKHEQIFCFDNVSGLLRYVTLSTLGTAGHGYAVMFNRMTNFGGSDVPLDATVYFEKQRLIDVAVEPLRAMTSSDATALVPSSTAVRQIRGNMEMVSMGSQKDALERNIPRVSNGQALLRLQIQPDGKVSQSTVIAASNRRFALDVSQMFLTHHYKAQPDGRSNARYLNVQFASFPSTQSSDTWANSPPPRTTY
ncbi:MAG: hypothetical protein JSS87_00830 [Acidobacteria bacterium]|nr:hypothetical protein [Acidobacteriota bacterium]